METLDDIFDKNGGSACLKIAKQNLFLKYLRSNSSMVISISTPKIPSSEITDFPPQRISGRSESRKLNQSSLIELGNS